MSYIQQMQAMRDYASHMAQLVTGIHTSRSLVIKQRSVEMGVTTTELIEITPWPVVDLMDPKTARAFMGSEVTVEMDDFVVKGISRLYTESQLIGTRNEYLLDAIVVDDAIAVAPYAQDYIPCDFISIQRSGTLSWNLILRRKADDR